MNTRVIYISIVILILSVGKSFGQQSKSQFQIAYENALLDSAYRYELLKPTLYSLRHAYTHQSKQVSDLKIALQLSEMQTDLQRKENERISRESKRKARLSGIKGAIKGAGVAAIIMIIVRVL